MPVPPTWEYAADAQLWNSSVCRRVLRAIGDLEKRTPLREMHMAFKIAYVYDYITKLCRMQVEVIRNHRNPIVRGIG
jgi:hypothetical protein